MLVACICIPVTAQGYFSEFRRKARLTSERGEREGREGGLRAACIAMPCMSSSSCRGLILL
jgi:hypothetical protein